MLNVDGYYTPLIQFLDHAVATKFIRTEQRRQLVVADEPSALLDRLLTSSD